MECDCSFTDIKLIIYRKIFDYYCQHPVYIAWRENRVTTVMFRLQMRKQRNTRIHTDVAGVCDTINKIARMVLPCLHISINHLIILLY